MNAKAQPATLLTIEEVAKRLGFKAVLSVYRRIRAGKLTARKEGREYRIEESELERYIAALPTTAKEGTR